MHHDCKGQHNAGCVTVRLTGSAEWGQHLQKDKNDRNDILHVNQLDVKTSVIHELSWKQL